MTDRVYRTDAHMRALQAVVERSGPEGVVLDRTVFYARAGGQPGDTGLLRWDGGEAVVTEAVNAGADVLHVLAPGCIPDPGTPVQAVLDWPRRHAMMRMHTALHLLCSLLPGAAVTGGQIGPERSRLDLDLPSPPTPEVLEDGFRALVAAAHPVTDEWVDESVLDTNPGLVRTLSVQPPRGTGRLRLVRIGPRAAPVDLQPCGGTHVRRTAEIGRVEVTKLENKGKQNRRVYLVLGD